MPRSFNGTCRIFFGRIRQAESSFGPFSSFDTGADRSATTSAHSRLPLAKLQKALGTDDQLPNRFSMVRGSYFPSSRYPRREGTARLLRTVSPQSLRRSLSWSCTLSLRGLSPAALTASFHLGKNFETEYLDIPAREMNSECDGARPSCVAMAAMEFRICRLFGMVLRAC